MAILNLHAIVPPVHAPGPRVSEALAAGVYVLRSDAINYNDTSASKVFHVPPNTLVLGVLAEVVTVHNGAIPSLSVGVVGAVSRHLATSDIDLKTAGFGEAPLRPYHYTADVDLIATIVASTDTAGVVRLYLLYRPLSLNLGLGKFV